MQTLRRLAIPLAILSTMVMVSQPVLATVKSRYFRNYWVYGVDNKGNASFKFGGNGTAKVFRFGNDELPNLLTMLARGSCKNKKKIPQVYFGLPVEIPDPCNPYYSFTSYNNIVTVLGFVFTKYGYNITLAAWRPNGQGQPGPPEDDGPTGVSTF